MDSIDLAHLERRTRLGYERARIKRALLGALPLCAIIAAAVSFTRRPESTLSFGAVTFALGALALWYGRDAQRAVLPGVLAGLPPLALALCANGMHHCSSGVCTSWCVPACTLGGVLAGLAVASVGHARRAGPGYWLAASLITLCTGAMGCACLGFAGVIGLTVGYAAGVTPGLARRVWG